MLKMVTGHSFSGAKKTQKLKAILEASASAIAMCGLGVSTDEIAKNAGVSKGTLFLYFSSKDELLRQLHHYLEEDMLITIATDYPETQSTEIKLRHIWERHFDWICRSSEKYKALRLLKASPHSYQTVSENSSVAAIDHVISSVNRCDISQEHRSTFLFLCCIMESIIAAVFDMTTNAPNRCNDFKSLGWTAFWGAASACISLC